MGCERRLNKNIAQTAKASRRPLRLSMLEQGGREEGWKSMKQAITAQQRGEKSDRQRGTKATNSNMKEKNIWRRHLLAKNENGRSAMAKGRSGRQTNQRASALAESRRAPIWIGTAWASTPQTRIKNGVRTAALSLTHCCASLFSASPLRTLSAHRAAA